MNNNRNQNNNRRRGRGNRNQSSGGGNQGNRIDSRARGNAPQLLDKYKKLAEDAHRNGDRVQAEYYLQFADHYFRVIADNRTRLDEQRGAERGDQRFGRRDEREQDDFDTNDESESDDRPRFENNEPERRDRAPRERDERPARRERVRRPEPDNAVEASEGPAYEPDDNPFVREAREPREERPKRRPTRARRSAETDGEAPGIDAAVLPPSFSAVDAGPEAGSAVERDDAAPPRPRRKRSDGGTLSAVG